ncbi:prepilin peptidase [Clostridium botulinum]|uniref:Prepilin peptidase n=1 Tax=Clostridium botulinum TaxID=1491 RepID=A0A6B4PGD5_CLOBO|nr:A24 family peptidase [Clostridium botulinum]EES48273.1 type IV leader peptidase family protein [Clostridium botulinum E1 str. 'BoNT E Beluga']MBY6759424.1 prepilin peptidase [Clostridium botulinum]MBY6918332.1 prepilin peptidase [Clostridium botulinum]MCR1129416.1 prepilin peptidase [Clostridium botulinum]NFG27576.1 prepilin peptidase [Clostridium botulinum]
MNYILVIIIGLVIGSFLNVCIYRIPLEQSISYPPSHCGTCNHRLKPIDLVPVISYLFLKGRCKYCKEKISITYPLIEILNAVLYLIIFYNYGLTFDFVKYSLLSSLLIVIGIIDYKTQDIYTVTIIFGVISSVIFMAIDFFVNKNSISTYVLGGLIGFLALAIIVIITKGMGIGDAEITLVCGLFLGIKGVIVTLFLGIIIGGIVAIIILALKLKDAKDAMAFGPCLSVAALMYILWGDTIINVYLKMVGII